MDTPTFRSPTMMPTFADNTTILDSYTDVATNLGMLQNSIKETQNRLVEISKRIKANKDKLI